MSNLMSIFSSFPKNAALRKKWSFTIRISVFKKKEVLKFPVDLFTFIKKSANIFHEKLLCSAKSSISAILSVIVRV